MEDSKGDSRRRHGAALKAAVLDECAEHGASVARVALAHGLNANLVHKWRRQASGAAPQKVPRELAAFMAVNVAAAPAAVGGDIRIELRRGATAINVSWPVAAASECAVWMRELLR